MADTNMDQLRSVDVPTLLASVAQQLSQNRDHLNDVDGAGTHGQRVATAFNAAAMAAANADSSDAGDQLEAAAQAMREHGTGKAASFYADGLEQAAADFKGQSSISADNLLPFLQSFLGGVERNNPAKAGQGTMLDAIQPAVSALNRARSTGESAQKGLLDTLTAAIGGTQSTSNNGSVDPGAASATNVIGGIITAVAPTIISMLFNQGGNSAQQTSNYGGGLAGGGLGGLLGGLLGNAATQNQGNAGYDDQQQGGGGAGDLMGGLLGALSGGGNTGGGQTGGQMGWIGGLLGGLMGGGQQQGQSGGGGVDLGGLLGGLMGGQQSQGQGQSNQPDLGDLGGLLGGLMGGQQQGQGQSQQDSGFGLDDIGGLLGGLTGNRAQDIDEEGKGGSQSRGF